MNKRKTKRSLGDPVFTSTPVEDESVENIQNFLHASQNVSSASSNKLSQKISKDEECSKTKKSKKTIIKPFATKYFEEIVEKAGLKLAEENDKHILTCDPMTFERNLKNILEKNVDYPRNVSEFVKGFKNISEDGEELQRFLIQNVVLILEDDEQRPLQDSVVKLFMNVSCLQEMLLDYILAKSTEFAIDDKVTQLQLLLKPLMFQDNINPHSKLIKGVLDLMDVAGHSTRQEIITCLPNIVRNIPHENIVLELVKYLSEDQKLIPTILDCLSFLSLTSHLKDQVRTQMLNLLKNSPSPHFFPNLVTFFFATNATDNSTDIIRGFRDGLDWTMLGSQINTDISSSQVMTIIALKSALTKCKNLWNTWIKVINGVKTPEEHKPLDIIILFVIYSTSTAKENTIEGIFRKRIKESLFRNEILDVTFKKFKPVLKEYLNEMLKIARALLKTKNEPLVIDFASHWFIILFKELKNSQKNVIRELLIRDYSENDDAILVSLNILTKLAQEDIALLKPHSLQIFALKDSLETLSIDGLHHVMDLLAGLAYGVENSFLDGDIHMMINKQLGSSDVNIKIRGIILGVMAVKHLVFSKSNQATTEEDGDISYSELSSIPDGPSKEAAMIIELIVRSTSKTPNLTCLFYDELSHILSTSQSVESKFIKWLSSYVTNDLTDIFIIDVDENIVTNIRGLPVSVEYCLNAPDEADGQIALNIAGLCFEESEDRCDMRILPSLLRLTQFIYIKQYEGDLSSIDALLGCGILMPKIESDDDLEECNPENIPQILDCFVYCINWFRELINAFCQQEAAYLRRRVIERLNGLICLEKKLANYLKSTPLSYAPPICSYTKLISKNKPVMIIKEKVKKTGKKKVCASQKSKSIVEDNDTSVLPPTLKTQAETSHITETSNVKLKLNTNFFRLFDLEVLDLFKEDLIVDDDDTNDALQNPNHNFNLCIVSLLLYEINPKLTEILPSKIKKKTFLSKPTTNTNQFHLKPADVVEKCIKITPRICNYMETIAMDIQLLLDETEIGRDSLGLLSQKCNEEQLCLSGLLDMCTTIFSWIGFQSTTHLSMLKEGLVFGTRNAVNKKLTSIKDLVTESCIYILRYKDWALLIPVAVSLVRFFKTLMKIYEDKTILKHMVLLSLDMLSVAWKDACGMLEKGLVYNQHLDFLLSCYFIRPDVNMIKSLTSELKEQVPLLAEKNSVLNTFKCVGKSNLPLLFRSSYGALYEATKNEIDKGLTDRQHIELWKNVAGTMNDFMEILKLQENRTNLLTFLKKSIPLFRLFLSQGMPMMELRLKNDPDSVVEVLKMIQHTTRFLHSLHCHSRLKKDTAFAAYLPQMKLILETLVYKVKIALTSNNCSEAFWMGNLKNKNLQGEIISSQSSTTSGEEDLEDQLPEDEDSATEDDITTDPGSKTVSKVF